MAPAPARDQPPDESFSPMSAASFSPLSSAALVPLPGGDQRRWYAELAAMGEPTMKRLPALQALSSDHHQGLVQARRLVRTASRDPAPPQELLSVARAFLTFWAQETQPHFRAEEEVLLPALAHYADPDQPLVVRLLIEHVRIRQLVAELARPVAAEAPGPATLQALGALLRAHIRYEEDVVFPLLETTLPDDALAALPGALAAFSGGS